MFLIGEAAWNAVDRVSGSLVSGGERREYLLFVPDGHRPEQASALVIDIHGFIQWPANQAWVSQWQPLAEREGFLAVYPSGKGLPKRWRIVNGPTDPTTVEGEVGFITDLIDHLSTRFNIDPERIFISGLSNGGGMALRVACAVPERVAAIGSVAGTYLVDLGECPGGVPAIFFHGTRDEIVPYDGGPSKYFNEPFPDIETFTSAYARLNGCDAKSSVFFERDMVKATRFAHCAQNAEVVLYAIEDGGHTWPGGNPLPEKITGKTTQTINATELMWEFFKSHPKNR